MVSQWQFSTNPDIDNFAWDFLFRDWNFIFDNGARSRGCLILNESSKEDDRYTGTIDIPGVKREDLSLQMEGANGKHFLHIKWARDGKSQERFWRLPDDVDTSAIDARLADGVLTLTMPKVKKADSRSITIR